MAYRKLNIDEELVSFAKSVLERDDIPYRTASEGTLMADIDDKGEEILIEDAMCEKQRAEVNPDIPVYPFRTILNKEKFMRLQRLNWPDDKDPRHAPFRPLKEDEAMFLNVDDFIDDDEPDEPIPGIEPGMSLAEALKIANEYYKKKREEQA